MITRNIVGFILHSKLMKFELFKHNKIIGNSNVIINNNNTTTINTICIDNHYRNMGYGTTLLQGIEKCIKNEYNIKNIKLLAWQAQGSTEVVDFFKKNGYNESDNDNINTYDDYDKIYELIKFNKRI